MIDKRSIATDGYRVRNTAKKIFAIAVAGYILLGSPTPPQTVSVPSQNPYELGMGSGGSAFSIKLPSKTNYDLFGKKENEHLKKLKQKQLQKDDEEILIFIKIFLQCQS